MELASVPDQIIVAAAPASAEFQGVNSDGEPADPGTVTVSITSSDGVAVVTDQATTGDSTNPRTFDLTAAQTAQVDRLTAVWKVSGTTVGTTVIDVVGRPTITFADYQLREVGKVSELTKFLKARYEVDATVLDRCKQSFVPRLAVERVWSAGDRTLNLRYPNVREVRWATDQNGDAITLTTARPSESGVVDLVSVSWPSGWIDIGYVHGFDRPHDDVVGAIAKAITAMAVTGGGITEQRVGDATAIGFVPRAGYGRAIYAIDEVDEVLNAHKWRGRVIV